MSPGRRTGSARRTAESGRSAGRRSSSGRARSARPAASGERPLPRSPSSPGAYPREELGLVRVAPGKRLHEAPQPHPLPVEAEQLRQQVEPPAELGERRLRVADEGDRVVGGLADDRLRVDREPGLALRPEDVAAVQVLVAEDELRLARPERAQRVEGLADEVALVALRQLARPALRDVGELLPGDVVGGRAPEPPHQPAGDLDRTVVVLLAERRARHAALDQHRAGLRVGGDQQHGAVAVPEAQRLRLVDALGVVLEGDLQHRLGAVRQADRCDELRVGRRERLTQLDLPRDPQWAPSAEMRSGSTSASGNRVSSSREQVAASSAQTITVGPEPESVAPAAPAGGSARTASRMRDGRYGWCSRSLNAAASSRASAAAIPAPSSAARATLKLASSCETSAGSASLASGVRTFSCGTTAIGVSGSVSATRAIRPSQVRQTPPARQAARLSEWPSSGPPRASSSSSGSSCPVHLAAATRPRAIVAALEPRPRARGTRSVQSKLRPSGEPTSPKARIPRCAGSGGWSDPSQTSTSFQRSSAAAAQSNPGPRFAVVAGARTLIGAARRRGPSGRDPSARRRPARPAAPARCRRSRPRKPARRTALRAARPRATTRGAGRRR